MKAINRRNIIGFLAALIIFCATFFLYFGANNLYLHLLSHRDSEPQSSPYASPGSVIENNGKLESAIYHLPESVKIIQPESQRANIHYAQAADQSSYLIVNSSNHNSISPSQKVTFYTRDGIVTNELEINPSWGKILRVGLSPAGGTAFLQTQRVLGKAMGGEDYRIERGVYVIRTQTGATLFNEAYDADETNINGCNLFSESELGIALVSRRKNSPSAEPRIACYSVNVDTATSSLLCSVSGSRFNTLVDWAAGENLSINISRSYFLADKSSIYYEIRPRKSTSNIKPALVRYNFEADTAALACERADSYYIDYNTAEFMALNFSDSLAIAEVSMSAKTQIDVPDSFAQIHITYFDGKGGSLYYLAPEAEGSKMDVRRFFELPLRIFRYKLETLL